MAWRPSDTQYRLYEKKRIEELRKVYLRSQNNLIGILNSVDLTSFQRYRTEQLLSQVNQEIVRLNKAVTRWSLINVRPSYRQGVGFASDKLKQLKVVRGVDSSALIHRQAVSVLIDDVAKDLLIVNGVIKKNVQRYIRSTQQKIIQDRAISGMLAEGLIQGEARRTVSDKLLNELRSKMTDGQMITIGGRNYRPDKYAELVARTRLREATTQGTVNTSLQYGNDLIQISIHEDIDGDDICNQYEGKVYSISGTDPDYPVADVLPPFHPNCRHVVVPITREAIEKRGLK